MTINDIIVTIGKHGKEMESNEESLAVAPTNKAPSTKRTTTITTNPNPKK